MFSVAPRSTFFFGGMAAVGSQCMLCAVVLVWCEIEDHQLWWNSSVGFYPSNPNPLRTNEV